MRVDQSESQGGPPEHGGDPAASYQWRVHLRSDDGRASKEGQAQCRNDQWVLLGKRYSKHTTDWLAYATSVPIWIALSSGVIVYNSVWLACRRSSPG